MAGVSAVNTRYKATYVRLVRLVCNQEVAGSIPVVSIPTKPEQGLSSIPFR